MMQTVHGHLHLATPTSWPGLHTQRCAFQLCYLGWASVAASGLRPLQYYLIVSPVGWYLRLLLMWRSDQSWLDLYWSTGPKSDCGYRASSTPLLDLVSRTMYAKTNSLQSSSPQRLWAIAKNRCCAIQASRLPPMRMHYFLLKYSGCNHRS